MQEACRQTLTGVVDFENLGSDCRDVRCSRSVEEAFRIWEPQGSCPLDHLRLTFRSTMGELDLIHDGSNALLTRS